MRSMPTATGRGFYAPEPGAPGVTDEITRGEGRGSMVALSILSNRPLPAFDLGTGVPPTSASCLRKTFRAYNLHPPLNFHRPKDSWKFAEALGGSGCGSG